MVNFPTKKIYKDISFLFLINLIFFFRPLFIDKFMFSTGEMLSECFGFYRYIGDVLRSGAFPLWDPYYYFPFAANIIPAVFYPFNLIASFISSFLDFDSTFRLIQLVVTLHFLLTSIFMYLFLRYIKVRREGALLGAVIFTYNAIVVTGAQLIYLSYTITWFPLVMLFFLKGIFSSDKINTAFLLSGVFLALSIVAGYITYLLYLCAVLVFCAIWFSIRAVNRKENIAQILYPLKGLLLVFLVALCLAAVQFIPTYEYFNSSVRKGVGYDLITMWGSTPPFHFISIFMPHFFGGAGAADWAWQILGVGFYVFFYYASGIAIFLLIFSIFLKLKNNITREIYLFFFFLTTLSFFLIMGKHNAVFGWLYSLPVLPVTRCPTRWALFLNFSLASIAGIALSVLSSPLSKDTKHNLRLIFNKFLKPIALWLPLACLPILCVLLVKKNIASIGRAASFMVFFYVFAAFIFIRLFRRFKNKYSFILIIAVFLDLFLANGIINISAPVVQFPEKPSKSFQNNPLIQFLKNDKDIFRVSGLPWPISPGQVNQIFSLGYMGGFHYVRLADFRGQTDPMGGSGAHSWFDVRNDPLSQFIDFYNIKYLITPYNLSYIYPKKYELIANFYDSSGALTGVGFYKNKNVFPRAFFVSDYEVMPDSKAILDRMEQVDLSEKTILEENPGFIASQESAPSEVVITDYKTQEINLEASVEKDGLLVMSEVYYPGWKVYVDGRETRILRANYVFRAIRLTPGKHKIKFIYSPFSVKIGLCITLLTIIVLSAIFIARAHFKTDERA